MYKVSQSHLENIGDKKLHRFSKLLPLVHTHSKHRILSKIYFTFILNNAYKFQNILAIFMEMSQTDDRLTSRRTKNRDAIFKVILKTFFFFFFFFCIALGT